MALTNEQYVASRGGKCPVCEHTNLEASQVCFDGHELYQDVSCLYCGSAWQDVYETKLLGYDNLEEE
jgi:hypothetical protein